VAIESHAHAESEELIQAAPVPGRVVGIDPGLNVTGYAVVEPSPKGPFVIEAGVIRPPSARSALGSRLAWIHRGVVEVLEAFPPSGVALERVHSHVKFPRTAILMAHARGVIVLAAAQRGIPVFGYAAARIKKTLTGSGRAPKAQIQHAIMLELGLDRLPEPHDVADACAVALCHYQIHRNLKSRGLA
jgi:crossover junction endodeoxyribonuclease RuvC